MANLGGTSSSILCGRILNITDLDEIIALLERHNYSKASYNRLGLRLKISHNTLEKIKKNHREVDPCFTECLASWLRKVDRVKNPTIDTLITTLRGIGENAVADGIDRERQNNLNPQIDESIEKPAKKVKVDSSSSFMQSKPRTASIKKTIATTSTTVDKDIHVPIPTRSHVKPRFETNQYEVNIAEHEEATLFKRYSPKFKKAMLNPVEVASDLCSNSIIDETTRNRITHHHGSDLVDAIEAYVFSLPKNKELVQKFERVLSILKRYIPLDSIVESLETEYYGSDLLSSELMHKKVKLLPHHAQSISEGDLPDSLEQDVETSKIYSQPQDSKTSTPSTKSFMQETTDQCDADYSSDPHIKQLENALQVYASDLSDSGLDTQATLNRIKARIESHIKKKLEDGLSKDMLTKQLHDLTMNALIPMDINDWCYNRLDDLYKEHDEKMSSSKDSSSRSSDDFEDVPLPPIFSTDVVYHASLCNLIISKASTLGVKGALDHYLSEFGHSFDKASLSNDMNILIALQENIIYIAFRHNVDLPLRYFCELLHQNKRLVFTGFLNGMRPAVSLMVHLWNLPYFSAKILLQNAACILFGFPGDDNLLIIQHQFQDSLDYLKALHVFLLDLIEFKPRSLRSYQTRYRNFFHIHQTYKESIYLIQKTSDGLKYTKSPSSDFVTFNPHSQYCDMQAYHQYVLRGYLDKEQYCIPSRKKRGASFIESLVPSISKIELYQHKHPGGNELSIVINGDNLWFCSEIEVNFSTFNTLIKTSVESVAQKQICYNQLLNHECFFEDRSTTSQIRVHSRFSNPLKSDVPIIYNEPDFISFRQSQLAKQTPSQIIQLSFLSALLEQSPVSSGRPTRRFKQIIKFLQEASTIVPMESAIFAVGSRCDSLKSSAKITQAIVNAAHVSSIPVSKMMISGAIEAYEKVKLTRLLQPSMYRMYDDFENLHLRSRNSKHFYSFYQDTCKKQPHALKLLRQGQKKHEKVRSSQSSALPVQDRVLSVFLTPRDRHLSHFECFQKICEALKRPFPPDLKLICGRNIGELYPISKAVSSPSDSDALTPLSQVLQNARTRLTTLSSSHKTATLGIAAVNSSMLQEVNKIIHEYLTPCVTMLGGFMEQQIRVPLVNSPLDTAKALRTAENSGAIGVWALFSLNNDDIKCILSSRKNEAFIIQITKFIEGTLSEDIKRKQRGAKPTSYDAKLQFLLELGQNRTITCSNDYISYSLERELVSICKEQGISTSTSVDSVIHNWREQFEDTGLALVPDAYLPLLARWLIWSLNIHQLREGLASYTTVGVIGLVNSGKSTLVNKIFNVETVQGTSQGARTTVPFIYNLDSSVEGLSVIDFPGVDDRDESIGDLAKLLVGLAQIVIFVCGYERFHTSSAMDWMKIFRKDFADTPILVCLTHADRLYENSCEKDMIPECPRSKIPGLKIQFEDELQKIIDDTARTQKCLIKFCSLTQTRHSPLNDDRGRRSMRKVGIFTPEDIGEWVKNALKCDIQQEELADKFSKSLLKF